MDFQSPLVSIYRSYKKIGFPNLSNIGIHFQIKRYSAVSECYLCYIFIEIENNNHKLFANNYKQMKKGLLVVLFFCVLGTMTMNAQIKDGLSFKGLVMDYQTFNGGEFTDFTSYHPGFEVGYHRFLSPNLSINVPLKVGVVQSHDRVLMIDDPFHKTVLGLDAKVNYDFLTGRSKIIPYVLAGIAGVAETEGEFNAQIPVGVGVKFQMRPRAYINWQSEYRKSLGDDRDNFHHGLGFIYLLGKKPPMEEMPKEMTDENDSDGDGLTDDVDLCPQAAGPAELNGCPDTDADGVPDYEDRCPQTAGPVESRGCPDSDGDGVSDNDDECPNMAGAVSNNGCPLEDDNDGDGIRNAIDDCPDQAGPVSNRGCPTDATATEDRDGDGVPDNQDRCPDQRGSVATGGCPDTDGDGVADPDDQCPRTAGTIANNGCPEAADSDADGILDGDDRCPNEFGPASTGGCPDTDNDGVPNIEDSCPNEAGPSVYNGCPDSDGDGIANNRDNCPNIAGTVSNNGCPEVTQAPIVTSPAPTTSQPQPVGDGYITLEEANILEIAMRAIQFQTARDVITRESYTYLNSIADLITRYPNYRLVISGHTDSTGPAAQNLRLSTDRAQACYEYLISRGVDSSIMEYEGFGETKPIADNSTLRGRQLNRRVEFVMERIQ